MKSGRRLPYDVANLYKTVTLVVSENNRFNVIYYKRLKKSCDPLVGVSFDLWRIYILQNIHIQIRQTRRGLLNY